MLKFIVLMGLFLTVPFSAFAEMNEFDLEQLDSAKMDHDYEKGRTREIASDQQYTDRETKRLNREIGQLKKKVERLKAKNEVNTKKLAKATTRMETTRAQAIDAKARLDKVIAQSNKIAMRSQLVKNSLLRSQAELRMLALKKRETETKIAQLDRLIKRMKEQERRTMIAKKLLKKKLALKQKALKTAQSKLRHRSS